ncbi:MAG: polysaccharide deacetylase family protein [Gammaproteobacteria bacterium]|nr:polysaccharide deacetylase family protein [Gammaproteobacteria bacterium]
MSRDFAGYGDNPPDIRWPDGSRLAVSVVLNVEEGAELSLLHGDERNEAVHEVTQLVNGAPDLCLASHFEYGTRVGYHRIMSVIGKAGIPITYNACARSLVGLPWLARDAIARGHEICSHGWRWEAHAGMDEAHERALIARAHAEIARVAGVAPVGWHTKSSASINTRRLLVEHGGWIYDSDAYNDDLPYYLEVAGQPHLVVPYSFDTNDMRFFDSHAFVKAADFAEYVIDTFDWLARESVHRPAMLSIGLHLRIMGRAGRIAGLARALEHMQQTGGAWFARRDQIARHWLEVCPPGG